MRRQRQNAFPENEDQDQSISDEEEFDRVTYDHRCFESLQSLYRRGEKDQISVASRLEVLEEGGKKLHSSKMPEMNYGQLETSTALETVEGISSEDEIEKNGFQNREGTVIQSHSRKDFCGGVDGEPLPPEEKSNACLNLSSGLGHTKLQEKYVCSSEQGILDGHSTWSGILKEAEKLGCLQKSSSHSETRKSQKGGGKAKPKFSFRFQSYKDGLSPSSSLKVGGKNSSVITIGDKNPLEITEGPPGLDVLEHRITEHSMADLLEDLAGESGKLSEDLHARNELLKLEHGSTIHSMAELLEGLQGKTDSFEGIPNVNWNTKEGRSQVSGKRISVMSNRSLDNEDPLDPMECGTSSEDEDCNQQQLSSASPKIKEWTMVDRFQEVLGAAEEDGGVHFPGNRHVGTGLYGRLQQVMQNEKDRHKDFLKQLHTEVGLRDNLGCMDVQILSRCLDAKLTVCDCLSSQHAKNPHKLLDGKESRSITIIFSPRICNSVELEAGNFIRIHPPWKEVQDVENKKIILCMYFSQILI